MPSLEIEDPDKKTKALIAAVNEIPRTHRDCLQFLVFHLSRVIQHASVNLVSATHLSFTTLIHPAYIMLDDTAQPRSRVRPDDHAPHGHPARTHRRHPPAQRCAIAAGEPQVHFRQ